MLSGNDVAGRHFKGLKTLPAYPVAIYTTQPTAIPGASFQQVLSDAARRYCAPHVAIALGKSEAWLRVVHRARAIDVKGGRLHLQF